MSDRIHFAHPDEEATFNRCRIYYSGQCDPSPARVRCATCRGWADDAESYDDDHHAAQDALRERLRETGWTMDCGRDFCPACSGEERGDE
jgi:hypothetical protein